MGIYSFLVNPKVFNTYYNEPAILMLSNELNSEPNQFVLLEKNEENNVINKAKYMAPFYSIFNTYNENNLPSDKEGMFAGFNTNVLFVCTSSYCSSPIYNESEVSKFFIK